MNNKYFSILKIFKERTYSVFFYFLKYKENIFFKDKKIYIKNSNIKKYNIKNNIIKEKQYKKNYRLKNESKLVINLFKEFILGIYEEKSYYIFYKYLGTFKKEVPLNYDLKLSKTMKIKGDLWTAPRIIHYYDPVLIELRTLKMRINNF
jgi:hypothetical protein